MSEILMNVENYGPFAYMLKQPTIIYSKDITKETWNRYLDGLTNVFRDAIEQDALHKEFITISFEDGNTIELSVFDTWFNIIMWYLLVETDQQIEPKHIFFDDYITSRTIKDYIDEFCIDINRRRLSNQKLNRIIADCLYKYILIDDFAFYFANTFNLEDSIDLMQKSPEFYRLMHPTPDEIPGLESVKEFGDNNVKRMIEIMETTDLNGYEHCLTIPLKIGEGANPKQFREFSVLIGTKPNNEGGIYPHSINHSFITGGVSDPYDYFLDANSARIAQILQKENVGTSGAFARLLSLNNTDTFLHHDPDYDCHTSNYEVIEIRNKKMLKMLNNRWYRLAENGMEKLLRKTDYDLIGKTIYLRSPMTCASAARGHGICYKCYGELAYVNNSINPGRFAAEDQSADLTQRLLSAKHLLETSIKELHWVSEFENFFEVEANCILLNDIIFPKGYNLLIDPEEIRVEDDDFEEGSSSDNVYSEYITRFAVQLPDGTEIDIHTEGEDPIYISNTLNQIIRKKGKTDNGRISVAFQHLADSVLFFIVLHNNELMKSLQDIKDIIDKIAKTQAKGMTKDKILQDYIDAVIAGGLPITSVHLEVILMNQIRNAHDVLEKPNWYIKNEEYQILTLTQALAKNPNVLISMMHQKLEQQLANPLTFRKHKSSIIDLFFMKQPQEYLASKDILSDKDTPIEGEKSIKVNPVRRVKREDDDDE